MKKLIKFFAIIILTFGFTTCDKIDDAVDDLTEFDFNTTLTENFAVTLENGSGMDISKSVSVNVDNDETHEYLSKIKSVKINSLTYQVTNHSGEDDTANLDAIFFADQTDMMNQIITIKEASEAGTIFEVTDVTYLNSIASKLKNGDNVLLGVRGKSNSEGPTDFVVFVTANVKVTASATK